MKIAIATFEGFNEIDSFVALTLLNRVKQSGWKAEIVCPTDSVTSMNGVTVKAQQPLEFISQADAVLFGSGKYTRNIVEDAAIFSKLQVNPQRQLIGSQCSGVLVLSKLGLLSQMPACTDLTTRPYLAQTGVRVLEESFFAQGNIATAGGCLAAQYLAAWVILRGAGKEAVEDAVRSVAPVGQSDNYVSQVLKVIGATAQRKTEHRYARGCIAT